MFVILIKNRLNSKNEKISYFCSVDYSNSDDDCNDKYSSIQKIIYAYSIIQYFKQIRAKIDCFQITKIK